MCRLAKKPVLPLNTAFISVNKPFAISLFLFEPGSVKSSSYCNLKSFNYAERYKYNEKRDSGRMGWIVIDVVSQTSLQKVGTLPIPPCLS